MNLFINDIEQEQNMDNMSMIQISGGYGFCGYGAYQFNPYSCAPRPYPVSCCVQFYKVPKVKFRPYRAVRKLKFKRRPVRLIKRRR